MKKDNASYLQSKHVDDIGTLSIEERRLIQYAREIPWGEFMVIMKYGRPVMLKKQIEDIKLTD